MWDDEGTAGSFCAESGVFEKRREDVWCKGKFYDKQKGTGEQAGTMAGRCPDGADVFRFYAALAGRHGGLIWLDIRGKI